MVSREIWRAPPSRVYLASIDIIVTRPLLLEFQIEQVESRWPMERANERHHSSDMENRRFPLRSKVTRFSPRPPCANHLFLHPLRIPFLFIGPEISIHLQATSLAYEVIPDASRTFFRNVEISRARISSLTQWEITYRLDISLMSSTSNRYRFDIDCIIIFHWGHLFQIGASSSITNRKLITFISLQRTWGFQVLKGEVWVY